MIEYVANSRQSWPIIKGLKVKKKIFETSFNIFFNFLINYENAMSFKFIVR